METGTITSLCIIDDTTTNRPGLVRIADLIDGKLVPFKPDPNSRIFNKRDRIYQQSGPREIGFVGIWDWRAVENTSKIGFDYIDKCVYQPDLDPIQVVEVENADSPEELIKILKKGVQVNSCEHRTIFICSSTLIGIYCDRKELEFSNGIIKLSKDRTAFPLVEIQSNDVIRIPIYPGGQYYRYLSIKETDEYVYALSPLETVKNLILQEFTRKQFQAETGGTIKDFKNFKNIVNSIGNNDQIIRKVSEIYHCSTDQAIQYIKKFQKEADEYIRESDVTDSMLEGIVANSRVLTERILPEIEEKWERENQKKVSEKNKELQELDRQLEEARKALSQARDKEKDILQQIREQEEQLRKKEELGDLSLKYVQDRISKAKEETAKFLSELVIGSGGQLPALDMTPSMDKTESGDRGKEDSAQASLDELHVFHQESCITLPSDTGIEKEEPAQSLEDLRYLLEDNLAEAGVTSNEEEFADYLLSAYSCDASILLAGPSSESIARAFSAAITGRNPLILDCAGPVNKADVQTIRESEVKVVLVRNLFGDQWKSLVLNLIDCTDKMFFCIYPFTEDLFMEPRSLYSYMLPVFTEAFVEKRTDPIFRGADHTGIDVSLSADSWKNPYRKTLKAFQLGRYTEQKVTGILYRYAKMQEDFSADAVFLFFLFPLAVVTESFSAFREALDESTTLSGKWKEYFLNFIREDE